MELFDFLNEEPGGEEEKEQFDIFEDDTPDFDVSALLPDTLPHWLTRLAAEGHFTGEQLNIFNDYYSSTNTIRNDRFDKKMFRQMTGAVEELRNMANSRWADDPTWFDLVEDEFLGFYKAVPELYQRRQMKATHYINHAAMDRASRLKEWEELRSYTQLDKWAAAAAAISFSERLKDIFDEEKDFAEAQEAINQANQDLTELLDQADQSPDEFIEQLREAADQYREARQGVEKAIKSNSNNLRLAAKKALKEAADEAGNVDALISGFGTEPGELSRMDSSERMALAARIKRNKKLRELADKIGRHVRFAMGEQARKLTRVPEEVHSIEMGGDLQRLIPSELVYYSLPETEDYFYKKLIENEAMQYKLRGTEKVGRGAIICLIDSSGSMAGPRETWAKAVAVAMLNIAYKQGRDFYAILFSSGYDPLREWSFPKGVAKINEVLDMAEYSYHGGTDFVKPIDRALEVLQTQYQSEQLKHGDILLITDGECDVPKPWLKEYLELKAELGFRMYGCLIGLRSAVVETLSDDVALITDLVGPHEVKSIFGAI